MTLHAANIQWRCLVCAEDWPCWARRQELTAEFMANRPALTVYMTAAFLSACSALPQTPAGELHSRFLGWCHTPRPP